VYVFVCLSISFKRLGRQSFGTSERNTESFAKDTQSQNCVSTDGGDCCLLLFRVFHIGVDTKRHTSRLSNRYTASLTQITHESYTDNSRRLAVYLLCVWIHRESYTDNSRVSGESCVSTALICVCMGLFCVYVGHICGCVGLFPDGGDTRLDVRDARH